MSRNRRPSNAEELTTYERLRFYARKFGQGYFNCLIFVGPPGRLKSSIIAEETKGEAHLISGHAKPFEVYCELQEHANQMLIIDDADGLYSDSMGQRLLKQLTNPMTSKTLSWTSNAATSRGIPKTFETKSNVCIIDNAWNTQNEHIQALEDRARLFLFDPPPREVHEEMYRQDWFTDDEIYQFVGENLCFISDLSVRAYVKAEEAKAAGENWKEFLLKKCVESSDLQMLLIEYDPVWKYLSVEEKAAEWCRRTERGRATYFNRKKSLLERMRGHPLAGKWSEGL